MEHVYMEILKRTGTTIMNIITSRHFKSSNYARRGDLAYPAAVYIVHGSRHERSLVAEQKRNHPCHLDRLRPALLRRVLETLLDVLRILPLRQRRIDGTCPTVAVLASMLRNIIISGRLIGNAVKIKTYLGKHS